MCAHSCQEFFNAEGFGDVVISTYLQPDFEVIGETANGEEALQLARKHRPTVVLMDLQMPVLDGVAATRRMRADLPGCFIIALTTFDDDESVFEGLRAGAVGYLLRDTPAERLFEAVRVAARGETFLQPSVARKVVAEFARLSDRVPLARKLDFDSLSERELEVTKLISGKRPRLTEALFAAAMRLRDVPAATRHIVLITDGVDSSGDAEGLNEAIRQLLNSNVTVHVIHYGSLGRKKSTSKIRWQRLRTRGGRVRRRLWRT